MSVVLHKNGLFFLHQMYVCFPSQMLRQCLVQTTGENDNTN